DGIRDRNVTGVQTCALPIFPSSRSLQHLIQQRSILSYDALLKWNILKLILHILLYRLKLYGPDVSDLEQYSETAQKDLHQHIQRHQSKVRSEEHTSELQSRFDLV